MRRILAYHESGHAMMHYLLDRPFLYVICRSKDGFLQGRVQNSPGRTPPGFFEWLSHPERLEGAELTRQRMWVQDDICIAYGGIAAEKILSGKPFCDWDKATDYGFKDYDKISDYLTLVDIDRAVFQWQCLERTYERLLENWAGVEALAHQLCKRSNRIFFEEVEQIFMVSLNHKLEAKP